MGSTIAVMSSDSGSTPRPATRGSVPSVGGRSAASVASDAPAAKVPPRAADGPWTVRALLKWIQTHLEERGVESPRLCAEILIGHVLACERLRLYMDADRVPTDAERATLRELVLRAGKHEPVQYLVGQWPFRGREFEVGPSTLIPRPSTETVVDRAIEWYRATMQGQSLRMADIGTGTGIIAVSIIAELQRALRLTSCAPLGGSAAAASGGNASAGAQGSASPSGASPLPEIQIGEAASTAATSSAAPSTSTTGAAAISLRCLATDLSPEAVALAKRNVARHGLSQAIDVRPGSLFEPFRATKPNSFDLLCSNPPYISDAEWAKVERNVAEYEPESALRGGADGLAIIRPLIADAPHWLRAGGLLLVEIGYEQGPAVLQLASDRSRFASAEILKDFEGLPRVLAAVRA